MARRFILLAAISGALLVMLGAFGAHALDGQLKPTQLIWWQKAVHYQGLHTLALFGCGLLALHHSNWTLNIAAWLFLAGMLLFSGSLYIMALTDLRILGLVTPFGGTAFIAAWIMLAITAWRMPR